MSEGAVSMEEFGPVSVDYFNERRVVDVVRGDGSEGAPVWTIHFEGGGLIHNFDPTLPMPTKIKGAAQTMVVMNTKLTELRFGLEQVFLNPIEYAISDPRYTKGTVVYAQRSQANMPSTPAHPDDRVQDGPEEYPDGDS